MEVTPLICHYKNLLPVRRGPLTGSCPSGVQSGAQGSGIASLSFPAVGPSPSLDSPSTGVHAIPQHLGPPPPERSSTGCPPGRPQGGRSFLRGCDRPKTRCGTSRHPHHAGATYLRWGVPTYAGVTYLSRGHLPARGHLPEQRSPTCAGRGSLN